LKKIQESQGDIITDEWNKSTTTNYQENK
jgi:hypothetical protein